MRKVLLSTIVMTVAALSWANWPTEPIAPGVKIDRIVVLKRDRRMMLYSDSVLIKTYAISLGRAPVGAKQREGDKRTPEGNYVIAEHKRDSLYHRALRTSYPSQEDAEHARAAGYSPGSDIMIHGMRNGLGFIGRFHLLSDWTAGCIAVTNADIDEIFQHVDDGAAIEIKK
jgi:murein L,D-transpeptidase YafK